MELIDNPDQRLVQDANRRRAELGAERERLERQLAELEAEEQEAPNHELLGMLPVTPMDLAEMPDELSHRLFEALR